MIQVPEVRIAHPRDEDKVKIIEVGESERRTAGKTKDANEC